MLESNGESSGQNWYNLFLLIKEIGPIKLSSKLKQPPNSERLSQHFWGISEELEKYVKPNVFLKLEGEALLKRVAYHNEF